MIAALALSDPLRRQLAAEANAAFPRECCGLIEGVIEGETARALKLHPCANLASQTDRFEIDPAAQIALLKALRGTARQVIGCYHSHPNGSAAPSPRDRDGAGEKDFVWLIQPATAEGCGSAAAYAFDEGCFRPLALCP